MEKNLGVFLTELREQKHWSVTEAAEHLGMNRAYLWLLENGKRKKPRPEIIKKLALGYGVQMEEFLGYLGYSLSSAENQIIEKRQEEEKINKAFAAIQADPILKFGTRLNSKLDLDAKRAIVQIYEEMKKSTYSK